MASRRKRVPGFDEPLPAPVIAGLDLSLRFTCGAAVPGDWGFDWSKVETMRSGESLRKDAADYEKICRLEYIEADVVTFLKRVRATHVFIEQYAYTSDHAHAHSIGELGGVIRMACQRDLKLPVVVVSEATARTLLGVQPRKDRKEWAARQLLAAGAPHDWIGEAADKWGKFDAFEQANFGLSLHGGQALIMRAPDVPRARKRSSKRLDRASAQRVLEGINDQELAP